MSPRPKKSVPAKIAPEVPAPATAPIIPPPTPPAVLKLQEQVVALVEQRTAARQQLSIQHAAYLAAQAQFQAAEAAMKDVEGDINYRLGLIAEMEGRSAPQYQQAPVLQMPSLAGVASESAPVVKGPSNQAYAMGDAGELRRQFTGIL